MDLGFAWCLSPNLFDDLRMYPSSQKGVKENHPFLKVNQENSVVKPVFTGFKSNTTVVNEFNNMNCSWNEREVSLLQMNQKCLDYRFVMQRSGKQEEEPYLFISPYFPPVIISDMKEIISIDIQPNLFEGIKPIYPLQGSTKLITERINFASAKAGAISIAKSKGMSGNNEVLTSNKYKYCIANCKSNKWFIFSLPEMVPFLSSVKYLDISRCDCHGKL